MATTNELLKARFSELCAQRDTVLAAAAPLRAERDALINQSAADLAAMVDPIDAQIRTAEASLPALMVEIASIATALGGNTAA